VLDRDSASGKVLIYFDGAEVLSAALRSDPALDSPQELLIGAVPGYFWPGITGIVDDVAIWKTARLAEEIQADFVDGIDDGAAVGLLAHWRFEESAGTAVVDSSPLRQDGAFGAGTAAPTRIQLTVPEFPDFALVVPDHQAIDKSVLHVLETADFGGFGELDDQFAVNWTGQVEVQPDPTSPGLVTFGIISDGRSRLYIDDGLVADHVHAGADPYSATIHSIELSAGVHDIRVEYVHNDGSATLAIAWDLQGSGVLASVIPEDALLRTDGTLKDATAPGLDDLVITDDNGVRVIHGRARGEWAAVAALASTVEAIEIGSGWSVAGVGDATGDGRDDIAMVKAGELRIYDGGGLPHALQLASTISGLPSGATVFEAGDVDGDAVNDLLITGSGGNYLIFGGDLPDAGTLNDLLLDPDDAGPQLRRAFELPQGIWRGIGDFDGAADADSTSYADLGAAVMLTTDRLNESAQLEHQVVKVYLGGDRLSLEQKFESDDLVAFENEDLVIEPGRPFFFAPGTAAPSAAFFGGAVVATGTDAVTRTLLAVTGPIGDSLRLYDGARFGVVDTADVAAAGLEFERDLFVLPLATPVPPGFVPMPPPGVDLTNDPNATVRDAFVLEGGTQNERLGQSQWLPDFNGDGFHELLISGATASYLFLGPVQLEDIYDVESQADVIIDAQVGRAASRMGDVTGDGLSDLVFVRSTNASGGFAVTVIAGGLANGTDLPRHVTLEWVTGLVQDDEQLRVFQRTLTTFGTGWASESASLGVLNWNDDGAADIALVRASPVGAGSNNGYYGLVFSGSSMRTC
jgi:hypothetical protein